MIESEHELVAFVADVSGTITIQRWLRYNLLFALDLAFVSVQDLEKEKEKEKKAKLLERYSDSRWIN